jgi:hypothetical protein
MVKVGGIRSRTYEKAWIALFVCMTTKALHLELVTGLCSSNFIEALKRFIARRGHPHTVHSDNGTNFIGAKSELKELNILFEKQNQGHISHFCASEGINWLSIPPRASHFGGEWEAGIKSVKNLFKKIAGNSSLTYQEMLSFLIQIEGILNSRPISALSSDPNDFNPLTPAHFLIGRPITSLPEPDQIKSNRLY